MISVRAKQTQTPPSAFIAVYRGPIIVLFWLLAASCFGLHLVVPPCKTKPSKVSIPAEHVWAFSGPVTAVEKAEPSPQPPT